MNKENENSWKVMFVLILLVEVAMLFLNGLCNIYSAPVPHSWYGYFLYLVPFIVPVLVCIYVVSRIIDDERN